MAPLAGNPTVRPSEHEPLGQLHRLRARAAVHAPRERVVGVERREDARLVAGRVELVGERLDVARDTARVGPGVRRDERDPHGQTVASAADRPPCERDAPWWLAT